MAHVTKPCPGAAASYEEGRNLLLSIAAGKLSMDDINKAHL